jgi:hypothetical protein
MASKTGQIAALEHRIGRTRETSSVLCLRAASAGGRIDDALAQRIWDCEVELQELKEQRMLLMERRRH